MNTREIVERHCLGNAGQLISVLAQGATDRIYEQGFGGLAIQAQDLTLPVPDYEEAAIQAGWTRTPAGNWCWKGTRQQPEPEWDTADTAELACQASNIEPFDREVYEFHFVTDFLAHQLEQRGEKIDHDFAGFKVWARTTTGQVIWADNVIEEIVNAVCR